MFFSNGQVVSAHIHTITFSGSRIPIFAAAFFIAILCSITANAEDEDEVIFKSHGFALYGELKYAPSFTHFSYVNPLAPKGGSVTLMATGTFDTLNPYTMKGISPFNTPGTFLYGFGELNESLLVGTGEVGKSGDETYSAYGLIAESVEYPANRSWVIFNLRAIAKFHDGKAISSEDVVFSYETLKEKGHPKFSLDFKDIASVSATSPSQVRVDFSKPNSGAAILRFGEMPILPKHYWQTADFEKTTLEPPLLNGPYRISDVDPGQSVSFARVNDYWGKDLAVNTGKYNFDSVKIEFYRDLTIAFEAFKGGEYDIFIDYTAKNWATGYNFPAVQNGKIIRREIPHQIPSGTQGFFFNTRRKLFEDVRVRQALSSVFDFVWINENLFYSAYKRSTTYYPNSDHAASGYASDQEKELLTPFKASLPAAVFSESLPLPEHQPERVVDRDTYKKAFSLLAEAGWTIKGGQLTNVDNELFEFEILLRQKGLERVLLPFSKNLEKLGIKTTIRLVDSSQYKIRLDTFDFDMTTFVLGQGSAPAQEQQHYFHSQSADTSGSLNLSGVKHPAVDALTERLLNVQTPDELMVTMQALDRVLLWNHYIIPNWHIDYHRVAYQNRFGIPDVRPEYSLGFENWWIKPSR